MKLGSRSRGCGIHGGDHQRGGEYLQHRGGGGERGDDQNVNDVIKAVKKTLERTF